MIPDPNMAITEHNNISDTNRKGLFGLTIDLLEILLTGNITLKTLCTYDSLHVCKISIRDWYYSCAKAPLIRYHQKNF